MKRFILLLSLTLSLFFNSEGQVVINSYRFGADPQSIASIESQDAIYSAYGTEFDDLLLPAEVDVTLVNASVETLNVTWSVGSYNATTEGAYTLSGTVTLEGSITNPLGLTASIVVNLEYFGLKIEPSNTRSLRKEIRNTNGTTQASIDTDNVGMLYDLGRGIIFTTTAGGTMPQLKSTASFGTLIRAGTNSLVSLPWSNYWKPLHAVNPNYAVHFVYKFETGADGGTVSLFGNNNLGSLTADAGLTVQKTTANVLRLRCWKKTAGQQLYDFTSTTALTVASGVVRGTININGTGATAGTLTLTVESGVTTTETFAVAAGADVTPSTGALNVLNANAPISLGALWFRARAATAGEITAWTTYAPARHSTEFLILNRDFDMTNQAKVFSDASGTVTITDGGSVRYVKDSAPTCFGELPVYTATAIEAPTWHLNSGKSYLQFSGAQKVTVEHSLGLENLFTLVSVFSNTDITNGSHIMGNGNSSNTYMVITGANYVGSDPSPYAVLHPDNGLGNNFRSISMVTGDNVHLTIRNNGAVNTFNNSVTTSQSWTNTDNFKVAEFGRDALGGTTWNHEGRHYRTKKYSGAMTEAIGLDERNDLKTFYAIP